MVLVHPGHLDRAEAVRLAAQPAAGQRGPAGGQRERAGGGAEDQRQLAVDHAVDLADGDSGGDRADHVAVAVVERDHGLHQAAEAAVHLLGDHLAPQGRLVVADELLPDPGRHRVGEPDAVGVQHHDEVHPGGDPGGLGPGLQDRGRVRRLDGRRRARGVREGLGHGDRAVAGLLGGVVLRLQDERQHRREHQQQHHGQLHGEDLPGHTAQPGRQPAAALGPCRAAAGGPAAAARVTPAPAGRPGRRGPHLQPGHGPCLRRLPRRSQPVSPRRPHTLTRGPQARATDCGNAKT